MPSLVWILSIRDLNSSQLLDVEPLGRTVTHKLTFSCRVFSQCVIRATQHGWDWDSRWLLSTCHCASPPSCLVTMDFPRWTQRAFTICSLSLCNKSQNQSSQAFFFSPRVQDYFKSLLVSISDCIWVDQTLCLGGGSWDCSPAGLILAAQHTFTVHWFHLLSPGSVLESASRLLSLVTFFFSLPTSLPCPQYRQKVLTMAVVKRVNG